MNKQLATWLERNCVEHLTIVCDDVLFKRCAVSGLRADCVEVRYRESDFANPEAGWTTAFINRHDAVNIVNDDFSGDEA